MVVKPTIYKTFKEARAASDAAYLALVQKSGRLAVGPSNKQDGLYIRDSDENVSVSGITEDEAKFIIKALQEIYGLTS